jgi:hypothetical protein
MGVQRSSADLVLRGKDNKNYRATPAGDVYDLFARILDEHMGNYIPGNPTSSFKTCPRIHHDRY